MSEVRKAALEAADRAGVTVRELRRIGEFQAVYQLFDDIWHFSPGDPPVPVELMITFAHAGGYVAGAFRGDELAGASVGFRAAEGTLHSHVTGARAGRGVGYALKLHQRAWCLERGLGRISWTFDPLVRRNARFNLAKLGARPTAYLENFYGVMDDAINKGDESDRLLTVWELAGQPAGPPGPPYAVGVEARDERPVVGRAVAGRAVVGGTVAGRADGPAVLVATPRDIETLRQEDPGAGRAWRLAVREVLGGLMARGGRVAGFTGEGAYIVVD
ncbi:putative GNAT superfamily acetyltransferase [Nonomuraea muscovyensis]|uniref:Putative GNAT superfamily acetyltransferase n=1 Tax=Nonomuraea muscovyensis TaxID=1124761 RepID=A0A7X0C6E6_9ACTN|nr:GNAT family N-acetyltransferase [Nonomuraea muscovyensis]MBB6349360.1 putative GNAT superfamily acetyltransferase [Nonomuraea muscovyensis]